MQGHAGKELSNNSGIRMLSEQHGILSSQRLRRKTNTGAINSLLPNWACLPVILALGRWSKRVRSLKVTLQAQSQLVCLFETVYVALGGLERSV